MAKDNECSPVQRFVSRPAPAGVQQRPRRPPAPNAASKSGPAAWSGGRLRNNSAPPRATWRPTSTNTCSDREMRGRRPQHRRLIPIRGPCSVVLRRQDIAGGHGDPNSKEDCDEPNETSEAQIGPCACSPKATSALPSCLHWRCMITGAQPERATAGMGRVLNMSGSQARSTTSQAPRLARKLPCKNRNQRHAFGRLPAGTAVKAVRSKRSGRLRAARPRCSAHSACCGRRCGRL